MTAFPRISIRRSAASGLLVTALALVAGGIHSTRGVSAQNQDPPPADASPSDPPQSAQSDPAQSDPAQPRPTFRVEAGFVRVDAYATLNGVAVRDLTANEFEVFEDGVPQKIETFEHVDVRGGAGPQEMVREPNSVREGVAEASDPRNRVFVIFLDKYFVDTEGSFRMKRSLVTMLERIIGPDDLFAVMTPEMSAKDIALARRTTTIENELTRHWAWGERGRMGVYEKLEAQLDLCYGAAAGPIIARLREKRTLDALTDLARYLQGIREERKAVIPITAGWLLYREDPRLTNTERPADPGRIGIGPDGRLTTDVRAADNLNLSRHQCDSLRQQLAFTDNWQSFHDLLGLANRANVSFYPVDPRGLAAIDSPAGFSIRPPHVETRLIRERVDNLLTLAEQTDGMAVVDTNALDRGMARIVDDLTSYYLLGYYTSNPKLDGKFRKIEVRAKRRGVEVRHRRGYRAATEEDIERARADRVSGGGNAALRCRVGDQLARRGARGRAAAYACELHAAWYVERVVAREGVGARGAGRGDRARRGLDDGRRGRGAGCRGRRHAARVDEGPGAAAGAIGDRRDPERRAERGGSGGAVPAAPRRRWTTAHRHRSPHGARRRCTRRAGAAAARTHDGPGVRADGGPAVPADRAAPARAAHSRRRR